MNPTTPSPQDLPSSHPEKMKAWLYATASPTLEKDLHLDTNARTPPAPKGSEVLVQVLTAALNPADYKVPELGLPSRLLISRPASPGLDFCGRVISTGPLAQHLAEGTLVYGCPPKPVQFGSLGEYVCVDATGVAALPEGVKIDIAAGLGVAGQTAYQSLEGRVSAGSKVFINGGSGGCGTLGIQIAKAMGCHVTVTCSTKNIELCFRLGADDVIDYTTEKDLISKLSRKEMFDCVVDHIGIPSNLYYESHRFLKEGGEYVQVGAASMLASVTRMLWPTFLGGGQRKYVLIKQQNVPRHLAQLGEWVADGTIQMQVDSVFEYADVVKAYERLRSQRTRGKILVHVNDPNALNLEGFGIGF
ncbi:hypothetical protein N7488_007214 [Penicillium malachiteum]|nr:hypothetical protein N7488_007214 [Penicillium malachiteum]